MPGEQVLDQWDESGEAQGRAEVLVGAGSQRPSAITWAIARLLGVSRSTIYKYVPELGDRAADATPALDTVLAALPADTRPAPDVTRYDDLLPSRQQPSGGR